MRVGLVMAIVIVGLMAAVGATAQAGRPVELMVDANSIRFAPEVEYDSARLEVVGQGVRIIRTFSSAGSISMSLVDDAGSALPDGTYGYSVRLKSEAADSEGVPAAAGGDTASMGPQGWHASGAFMIKDGVAYSAAEMEVAQKSAESARQVQLDSGREIGGPFSADPGTSIPSTQAPEDFIVNDDLIVEGRVCASSNSGCVNGQAWNGTEEYLAFGIIPSIMLDEDWPTNGLWEFDTSVGNLRIGDDTSGTLPVTIQQGTPTNTLFLNSSGLIGSGTAAPAENLHIVDGVPRIRLEGSSSNWESLTASTGFWFRDVAQGGFVYPVKFMNGAPPDSLVVGGGGDIGMGTASPGEDLHIVAADPQILVESTGAAAGRTLAYMKNSGDVRMFWENTNSGDIWQMSLLSTVLQMASPTGVGKFRVRKNGGLQALTGSTEIMALNSTGDLTVKSVTQTSSRVEKRGFESVDAVSVLEKVAGLPISEWSYKADSPSVRHIGPMSEDFHAAFGLGKTDKGLTSVDTSGVALAAIQGLNQKLAEKDARIDELELRLQELEQMVQDLAQN